MQPDDVTIRTYQGDTLTYLFRWFDDEGEMDLDNFDEIIFRAYHVNKNIFEHTLSDEDIEISDTNHMSGKISGDILDITPRVYTYEVEFIFADGTDVTYLAGDFDVFNKRRGGSGANHEMDVTVSEENQEVTVNKFTPLDAAAIATQALSDVEDRLKELDAMVIPEEEETLKAWVTAESFETSNISYSDNGNIESADIVWPDGEDGSISDLVEDSEGRITSLQFNRSEDKYITVEIEYDGNELNSTTITATGY